MALSDFLQEKFHYPAFRPGQEQVIKDLLKGDQVLGIFPTGYGKTLLYHFIGAYQQRPVIIFSPLKALMLDQVNRHQGLEIGKAVAISSQLSLAERKLIWEKRRQYRYFYLSPEMAKNPMAQRLMRSLENPLLVVDEAHCISQWGRDFRPEYMDLLTVRKGLGYPQTLAITATATPQVIQDIEALVFHPKEQVLRFRCPAEPVKRHLAIIAEAKNGWREGEKEEEILKLLPQIAFPVLIYTAFRQTADELANRLRQAHYLALSYHAGLSDQERYQVQEMYLKDQIDCVVATSAFGMGVDKANIRTVIHFHPSQSIEAFVQEIGRAGRDGLPSQSIAFQDQAFISWVQGFYRNYLKNLEVTTIDLAQLFQQEDKQSVYEFYKMKGLADQAIRHIFAQQFQFKINQVAMVADYLRGIEAPQEAMENYLRSGQWRSHSGPLQGVEQLANQQLFHREPIPMHWQDRFKQLYGPINAKSNEGSLS